MNRTSDTKLYFYQNYRMILKNNINDFGYFRDGGCDCEYCVNVC